MTCGLFFGRDVIKFDKSSRRERLPIFAESIAGPPSGRLGPRVMGLVVEWALQHRDELLEDWRLARESAPLNRIGPLE
jgi:hypothetical protein